MSGWNSYVCSLGRVLLHYYFFFLLTFDFSVPGFYNDLWKDWPTEFNVFFFFSRSFTFFLTFSSLVQNLL